MTTTDGGTEFEVQWNNKSATFADANVAGTRNDETSTIGIDLTDLANGVVSEIKIVVSDADDTNNDVAATNFASHTYTITLSNVNAATSTTAGSAVRLSLDTNVTAATGDVITVNMKGFGIPSTLDADHFTVRSGATGAETQHKASDVTRSGDNLEITVPDMNGDTAGLIGLVEANATAISISSRAGITNPTAAGLYGITINDDDATGGDDAVDGLNVVTVVRSVSLSPKKGSSTADVAVTGKGFSGGSATVFIDKTPGAEEDDAATTDVDETDATYDANGVYDDGVDVVIATGAAITGGSFTATIPGISKPDGEDKVYINAFDGGGKVGSASVAYTFGSGLSVSPESISWGQTLTLTMSDNSEVPTEVRFGGNNTYKVDVESGATAKSAKVKVPAGVPVGSQNVEVISSSGVVAGLSSSVEIVPLSLNISPSNPVPGQRITIRGSGFEDSKDITAITFGSLDEVDVSGGNDTSTSAGNVSYTYNVPLDIGTGEKKVTLDVGERIGEGSITVPKAAISISPTESLIGSKVAITGSGFASSKRVEVFYDGEIEAVGVADSDGNVNLQVTVPSTAGIGSTNPIEVKVRDDAGQGIKATANHKTPGAMITVSENVQAGGTMTINGSNFQGYSVLSVVTVGGQNVIPAPAPETDRQGAFQFQVRVPLLSVGSHNVTIVDGDDNSATETFNVVDTPVSSAPADIFSSLGDRLVRVWKFDAQSQTWSFYDPRPEFADFNTLTSVGSEIVTIIVSEGGSIEFASSPSTLYAGTNQVLLD